MKLRIKFAKHGTMKFIGHLDIMRYFQKAIRRAEIDIAYSTGFSPHQIMSFAAPLGVGLESDGEYLDIEVNSITSEEDMKKRLNEVMVEGMEILSIKLLPENAGNAMASVAAAKYLVTFRKGYEPDFDWQDKITKFLQKPSIIVTKQTKKSEKELDLKPYIFDCKIEGDAAMLMVDASSSGNIKPNLVMEAFYKENGKTLGEFDLEITRMDTYGNKGTVEDAIFVPLEEFGNDF